jgi:two-component system sensor histidine kinase YesM
MKIWMGKLKNRILRISFYKKILLSYVLLGALIIGAVGLMLTVFMTKILVGNEEKSLAQTLLLVNENIESRIDSFNNLSFDIVINSEMKSGLNKTDAMEYSHAREKINSILETKILSTEYLTNLMIIDTNNNTYSTNLSVLLPRDFKLEDTGVYREAQEGNGNLVWLSENDIFENYGTRDRMYSTLSKVHAAAVIKNYSLNQVLGILIITLDKNYFNGMTFAGDMMKNCDLYMVSSDRSSIFPLYGTENVMDETALANLELGKEENNNYIDKDMINICLYNRAMDWYLVGRAKVKILYTSLQSIYMVLLITLLAALILETYFTGIISKRLTRGMKQLMISMEEVEKGNFDVQLNMVYEDDFGRLASAFNHMVKQINDLIISEYEQEILMKKAEFKALQAQIKPHFLYNTLDMLNWKLQERNQEDLGQYLVSLGDLLRYYMSNNSNNVTLGDEIKNIKDYLHVGFSISNKEIKFIGEADKSDKIILPRPTLQPVVENSVKHGFSGRNYGNRLEIKGYFEGSHQYYIDVTDNGIGIPEEKLNTIRACVESTQGNALENDRNLGLSNIKMRISYIYGKDAFLTIESRYGTGTRVRFILPLEREDFN